MGKRASFQRADRDGLSESVFVRPIQLPGMLPSDRPARLRDDVRQEALEAAADVLRSNRPLPPAALQAIVKAIHSPPGNLTLAEAAIGALQAYNESHPSE